MIKNVTAVLNDESGQGLVEYGLILSLVAIGCILALTGLKTQIVAVLGTVGNAL